MEFNQAKYKECEHNSGHDWGYGLDAGNCVYCGLIHDCESEDKYEFDGDNYICEVCHLFPTTQVLKEIEQAKADALDLDLEYRRAIL